MNCTLAGSGRASTSNSNSEVSNIELSSITIVVSSRGSGFNLLRDGTKRILVTMFPLSSTPSYFSGMNSSSLCAVTQVISPVKCFATCLTAMLVKAISTIPGVPARSHLVLLPALIGASRWLRSKELTAPFKVLVLPVPAAPIKQKLFLLSAMLIASSCSAFQSLLASMLQPRVLRDCTCTTRLAAISRSASACLAAAACLIASRRCLAFSIGVSSRTLISFLRTKSCK